MTNPLQTFYPRYYSQNNTGDTVTMPAAVEVITAGIRLVYPTSYVLVTDYDSYPNNSAGISEHGETHHSKKSSHTCDVLDDVTLMGSDVYHVEPSPFTTSNHPLLGNNDIIFKHIYLR